MRTIIASSIIAIAVGLLAQAWKSRSGVRWFVYAFIPTAYASAVTQDAIRIRNPVAYTEFPWAVVRASLPFAVVAAALVVLILALLPRR